MLLNRFKKNSFEEPPPTTIYFFLGLLPFVTRVPRERDSIGREEPIALLHDFGVAVPDSLANEGTDLPVWEGTAGAQEF